MTTQTVNRDDPILGFTHDWIASLANRVDSVHVLTAIKGRVALPSNVVVHHLTAVNQPIHTIANHRFHHATFRKLILGKQIDAVFVHMIPKWAIAAAPYCKLARVPLVLWYAHGHVPNSLKVAEKMADGLVSSTPEGCRLASPKLRIVGQGIDTTHFKPAEKQKENGRFRILTVGRLSPVKNLERTIEAIHQLVNHHGCQNVELHFIGGAARTGDEAYIQKLTALIATYKLEAHIQFVGTRTYDTIVAEYQQANALLNLSNTNSLDKVALEAMACGIPVLTSNPAFHALMVKVDESLYLDSSAPEQTAVSLKKLINQPISHRQQIGQKLRQQVIQEHNLDQLAKRLILAMEQAR